MIDLHIYNTQTNKWVEVPIIDSTFNLTIKYEDYESLGSRFNSYTKNIDIPPTPTTDELFRHSFNVNLIDNTFSLNTYIDCKIILNGNYFKTGKIRINSIELNKSAHIYKCVFFTDAYSIIADMEDNKLSDMDNSELQHEWTTANVKNSWNDFILGNVDYVYPWIDYGKAYRRRLDDKFFWDTTTPGFDAYDLFPAVRVKYYIDKIFETYDYTYECELFDNQWFKQLILPFNKAFEDAEYATGYQKVFSGEEKIYDYENYNLIKQSYLRAEPKDYIPVGGDETNFPDNTYPRELYPNLIYRLTTFVAGYYPNKVKDNYFFNVDGIDYNADISGVIKGVEPTSDILSQDFSQRGYTGVDVLDQPKNFFYKIKYPGIYKGDFNFKMLKKIDFDDEFAIVSFVHAKAGEYTLSNNSFIVTNTPTVLSQVALYDNDLITDTYKEFSISFENINLEKGDVVFMRLSAPNNLLHKIDGYRDAIGLNVKSVNFYTKSVVPLIPTTLSHVSFTHDMSQKDFISSITKIFNLIWEQDKFNPKHFIIKTKDDFYNDGEIRDFQNENLIDINNFSIETPATLSGKKIKFKHKQDTQMPVSQYNETINDLTERYFSEKVYDNQYSKVDGENIIETNFTETPLHDINLSKVGKRGDIVLTRFKNSQENVQTDIGSYHILFFNMVPFNKNVNVFFRFDNSSYNVFPYAGHLAYPSDYTGVEDILNYDLNFDTQPKLPYIWSDYYQKGFTNLNLFNSYWANTVELYTNPNQRIITCDCVINEELISKISLADKIFFNDQYWRIVEISDWNNTNHLTQIKLIRDLNLSISSSPSFDFKKILATTINDNSVVIGGGNMVSQDSIVLGDDNNTNNSLVVGSDNIVYDGVVLNGNNNLVYNDSIVIAGNNNVIYNDDVIVIGTSNYTSTNDGEIIINNIIYNTNGSITFLYGLNDEGKNGYNLYSKTDTFLNDEGFNNNPPIPNKGILNDSGKN